MTIPKLHRTVLVLLGAVSAALPALAIQASEPGWEKLNQGAHDDAVPLLRACLAERPDDARCAIGLAALLEGRGEYGAAHDVLEAALRAGVPEEFGPGMAARTLTLSSRAADGGAAALPLLEDLAAGNLLSEVPEVRSVAALALADVLARLGRPAEAESGLIENAGRIRTWTLLGPYGNLAPLALDRRYAPEKGDLDPSDDVTPRGEQTPHRIDARFPDGRIVLPAPFQRDGAVYAATDVVVKRATRARLRVGSAGTLVAFVDGAPVIRLDRLRERPPYARAALLELGPGRHRILVKMVSGDRYAAVAATLEALDAKDAARLRFEHPRGTPEGTVKVLSEAEHADERARQASKHDPAALVAAVWWLKSRGLDRQAGAVLARATEAWPDAPLFALDRGEFFARAETGAAPEEDLAQGRALLERAIAADPKLLRARLLLADMDRVAGRIDEAWTAAEATFEFHPEHPDTLGLLARLAGERGWQVEAANFHERARAAAPGRSDLLSDAIQFFDHRHATEKLRPLLEEQHRRYPLESGLPGFLALGGETGRALELYDAAIEEMPSALFPWLAKARLMLDLGRPEESLAVIDELGALYPRVGWIPRQRASALTLLGRDVEAREELERALALEPGNAALREVLTRLGGEDFFRFWLVDARQVIDDDRPRPGLDSALLADIAATWIDEQGGQTQLYQGVHAVYTRAGVEHEGELQLTPGSDVREIKIHKPDGSIRDVRTGQQQPVSMPGLAPGDAIEYVSQLYTPPLGALPGVLNNSTLWLFQGGDRDYVLSRYVVAHPADLPLEICGNQTGLEFSDGVEDGVRTRSWTARQMPRLPFEPHIADRYEAIPHIRLGLGLSWEQIGDLLRAGLVGKLRLDDPLPAMIDEIRERAGSDDKLALARALHAVVLERIRPGRVSLSLGVPASVAASAGEGNRAGVALALARALELDAELVFARSLAQRGSALDCPSSGLFPFVLIKLRAGDREVYLNYNEADHPFDDLPPRIVGADALFVPLDITKAAHIGDMPERKQAVLQEQDARLLLREDGRVEGQFKVTLRGGFAAVARQGYREIPPDRREMVHQAIAGKAFPGARVMTTNIEGLDDPEAEFVMTMQIGNGAFGRRTPTGVALPVTLQALGFAAEFASLPSRSQALFFDSSAFRKDSITLLLPEGLTVETLPEGFVYHGGLGDYALDVSVQEGLVTMTREAAFRSLRIEPEDYPQFRALALQLADAEQRELVLGVDSPALTQNP